MTSHRRWLVILLSVWVAYALLLGEVFPFFLENVQEIADVLGLDWLDRSFSVLMLASAVLPPLALVLVLHRTGRLRLDWRRLTPAGRALARNQAGMALFQRGGYVAAIEEFTAALRLDPRLVAAHANRGTAYFHLKKPVEALADLDAALRLAPNLVDALSWRGLVLAQTGNPDRALEDLDRAMAQGARHGTHYATRGAILLAKEDYDQALSDCTEAILRGNNGAADFSNRGMAWLGKKDYERAIADFDEAIHLDGRYGLAFNNRGVALQKQGAYAHALDDFHEAIRLTPALPNSYKNLAWLRATCPQAEFRDGAVAVVHAQKALDLVNSSEPEWLGILAAAYAESGDFQKAVQWQEQCLARSLPRLNSDMESRLAMYKEGRPYRDNPGERSTQFMAAAQQQVCASTGS